MELKPIIVTSHLLFGFTVFTYMSWIYQSNSNLEYIKVKPQVKLIGFISLFSYLFKYIWVLGLVQIMLHSHALHFHIVILI